MSVPHGQRVPPYGQRRAIICKHPSYAVREALRSLPAGKDRVLRLAWCHLSHTLQQNKGACIESRTRIFPHKMISPAQLFSSSSLGKEVFHPQGHAYVTWEGLKDGTHRTALPNRTCSWSERELEHDLSFVWGNNLSSRDLLSSPCICRKRSGTWDGFHLETQGTMTTQARTTTSGLFPQKAPGHRTAILKFHDKPRIQTHDKLDREESCETGSCR